jgi:hypothetical protein
LGENTSEENMGVGRMKLPKPEVPKQATTIRFGWTRGNDRWTSGENTLKDEMGVGKLKLLEA